MQRFTKKLFSYFLLITTVIGCSISNAPVEAVLANSAQSWFHGVNGTGMILTDKECPVVVEHETLRLNIQDVPTHYGMQESYDATVTAEYTLYNPSEYTITVNLLFPFGNKPEYSTKVYDKETETYIENVQQYDITVNDKLIEKKVRHSYSQGYFQFDTERDLKLLKNDFVTNQFYSTELLVTEYTYRVGTENNEQYNKMAIDIPYNYRTTSVICIPQSVAVKEQENGKKRIVWHRKEAGEMLTLYVIGKPFESFPHWKFYEDYDTTDGKEVAGNMILESKKQCSFLEFALQGTEQAEVSEVDRYNAVVAMLEKEAEDGIVELMSMERRVPVSYMRWYEYEISIAPGERIINKVTAPLYPAINSAYDSDVFEYTYLLSPAKTWKEFGTIDVEINTPYFLVDSEIQGFEKTESGYKLSLPGVPDTELKFSLSETEHPTKKGSFWKGIFMFFNTESKASKMRSTIIFWTSLIVLVIVMICLFGKKNNDGKD